MEGDRLPACSQKEGLAVKWKAFGGAVGPGLAAVGPDPRAVGPVPRAIQSKSIKPALVQLGERYKSQSSLLGKPHGPGKPYSIGLN